MSQIDLVQIEKEDFFFAERFVNPIGEYGLLEFSAVTSFWCQKKGLGNLLGDGAAALNDRSGLQVFKKCPDNTLKIDPPVCKKSCIFSCDKGIEKLLGHFEATGLGKSLVIAAYGDIRDTVTVSVDSGYAAIKPGGNDTVTIGSNIKLKLPSLPGLKDTVVEVSML